MKKSIKLRVVDGNGAAELLDINELDDVVSVAASMLEGELSYRFPEVSAGRIPKHLSIANLLDPRLKGVDLPEMVYYDAKVEIVRC